MARTDWTRPDLIALRDELRACAGLDPHSMCASYARKLDAFLRMSGEISMFALGPYLEGMRTEARMVRARQDRWSSNILHNLIEGKAA